MIEGRREGEKKTREKEGRSSGGRWSEKKRTKKRGVERRKREECGCYGRRKGEDEWE